MYTDFYMGGRGVGRMLSLVALTRSIPDGRNDGDVLGSEACKITPGTA